MNWYFVLIKKMK